MEDFQFNVQFLRYGRKQNMILDSSMVEHSAVNRGVVGSSPTRGAEEIFLISPGRFITDVSCI